MATQTSVVHPKPPGKIGSPLGRQLPAKRGKPGGKKRK